MARLICKVCHREIALDDEYIPVVDEQENDWYYAHEKCVRN